MTTPYNKKHGIMRSLRSAIFGRKGEKGKKTKMPLPKAHDTISTIVESVRPLHVIDIGQSPETSRVPSYVPSTSSSGMTSRFSSANNLLELDYDMGPKECIDVDETFYDGIEGDEMIDVKAEEFINKFYEQVHAQGPNDL